MDRFPPSSTKRYDTEAWPPPLPSKRKIPLPPTRPTRNKHRAPLAGCLFLPRAHRQGLKLFPPNSTFDGLQATERAHHEPGARQGEGKEGGTPYGLLVRPRQPCKAGAAKRGRDGEPQGCPRSHSLRRVL